MNKKLIAEAAKAHAVKVLGEEQAKKNKPAIQSISADFLAGVEWLLNLKGPKDYLEEESVPVDNVADLHKSSPALVEEYKKMGWNQLLNQICAEVTDLFDMQKRVQLFMEECTVGLSKTTYTLEVLQAQIADKKRLDILEDLHYYLEDNHTDKEILADVRKRATEYKNYLETGKI